MKPKQKTVIALIGKSNIGKSRTLKQVFEWLMETYPDAEIEKKPISLYRSTKGKSTLLRADISVILTIGDARIGIESMGDPAGRSRLTQSLNKFSNNQPPCDVILCAIRDTKDGKMRRIVEQLRQKSYVIVWIKKERLPEKGDYEKANSACAQKILLKIKRLLAGEEA